MSGYAARLRDPDAHQLNGLLTWLLTAVSQPFFHMLVLPKRGRPDLAARIKVVDEMDLPNAMRIIDLLLKGVR